LSSFFERAPHRLVGELIRVAQLHHPIGKQPQRPTFSSLGRFRTRERYRVRLGSTVQDPSPGPAGFPGHQRHFQALLAQASALPRNRGGGDLKSIGDELVSPVVGSVSLEQDASGERLLGREPCRCVRAFTPILLVRPRGIPTEYCLNRTRCCPVARTP
jgi:hypothetical protein